MVYLEGPEAIAKAASDALDATLALSQAALDGAQNADTSAANEMVDAYRAAHVKLLELINIFAQQARDHLNSKR
ncbi:hypothetical protein ACIF70_39325 [Actinacidiphila glaucinigra]|uniref:hypothetical protein n=1 Tax=Actinacidiphila glaucinigra TaxID=235986 RepID=UPI0037C6C4F9